MKHSDITEAQSEKLACESFAYAVLSAHQSNIMTSTICVLKIILFTRIKTIDKEVTQMFSQ